MNQGGSQQREADETARWWAELHAGPLNPRRRRAFEVWLAADSGNARRLAECEAIWSAAAAFGDDPEMAAYMAPAKPRRKARPPTWFRRWPQLMSGNRRPAAAFVMFAMAMLALAFLLPDNVFTGNMLSTGIGEQVWRYVALAMDHIHTGRAP